MAAEPDETLAYELVMYIDNESNLYPQKQSIQANLINKILAGKYDRSKAPQLWGYLVEAGAKKYHKEFGYDGKWNDVFDTATRRLAAERMAREFEAEYEAGELEHITEKVRPKGKRKNPSVSPVAIDVWYDKMGEEFCVSTVDEDNDEIDCLATSSNEKDAWARGVEEGKQRKIPVRKISGFGGVEKRFDPSKSTNPTTPAAVKARLMR